MRTPQTPEVIATRNRVDELLKFVPNKRHSDCTPLEQSRFDELSAALAMHRVAVRQARSLVTKKTPS